MAKVRTPLLSFGATGKLADTLVYFSWKGLEVVRSYVIPSNPNTPAQQTQRTLFTDMVASWRNYFVDADMRSAWDRAASAGKNPQSGFNSFMSAALQIGAGDADASFAFDGAASAGGQVTFGMLNIDDGATGDEAGNFEIWAGLEATSLLLKTTAAIGAGDVSYGSLEPAGTVEFVKLRKDGQDRSGVVKVTILA